MAAFLRRPSEDLSSSSTAFPPSTSTSGHPLIDFPSTNPAYKNNNINTTTTSRSRSLSRTSSAYTGSESYENNAGSAGAYARSTSAGGTSTGDTTSENDDDGWMRGDRYFTEGRALLSDTGGGGRSRSRRRSGSKDVRTRRRWRAGAGAGGGSVGGGGSGQWKGLLRSGRIGDFLRTSVGWQVYVGGLVLFVGGSGFGLVLMNRFILSTGVYKFPYPLTATLLQLLITYILFNACAASTRFFARPLTRAGLATVIAPFYPDHRSASGPGIRSGGKVLAIPLRLLTFVWSSSGGIAGGGFLELDRRLAWEMMPLAFVFVGKVVLSNLSFAYAVLPVYTLARIAVVPLCLLLSHLILRTNYGVATLSSTLTAVLNLLIASSRSGVRVTWESIVAGIASSAFVALYPILLLRTYRHLVSSNVGANQNDFVLSSFTTTTTTSTTTTNNTTVNTTTPSSSTATTNSYDDTPHSTPSAAAAAAAAAPFSPRHGRAFWRITHYTTLLAIAQLAPVVLLSGELGNIARNCYFLDVCFFWFLMLCGGVAGCAVLAGTLLLVVATSPLSATMLGVPRAAAQLVLLGHFRMPAHSWVGVVMCWISSVWYLSARREEVWWGSGVEG